jgi:nitrogen-specific signal transduction histidine kinase
MSKIYDSLMKAEREKQRGSNERPFSQIFEPEKAKMVQETVTDSPPEKIDKLKLVTGLGEKRYSEEQSSRALSLFFVKLANSIKTNLNVLKMVSELSRGKFKDVEFENNFIKAVNEYIHGTNSGLDCFFDYLKIRSPVRRKNIVHAVLEEILDGNEEKFKERKIQVVKKQFEMDLPETSIREDHLRYILNWVVQYAISSVSSNGNIGLFTRPFDFQEVKDDSQSFLKKDRKYIEVIIFFTTHEKVDGPSGTGLGEQALIRENQNDFILPLVEEIISMNGGIIRVKADHKRHWTQILLILPA